MKRMFEKECETEEVNDNLPATQQFVSPQKSIATYRLGFVPKNTSVNTVKYFTDWKDSYNARHPDEASPGDVLLSNSSSDLSLFY